MATPKQQKAEELKSKIQLLQEKTEERERARISLLNLDSKVKQLESNINHDLNELAK